ncbi:hypothetical protein ACFQ9X_14780 [Catenulispora yoronensis]
MFVHGSPVDVVIASGLLGVGVGMAYAAMPAYINASVPVQQSGIANGMNAVLRTVGGAIGTAVTGAILAANVKQVAPGVALPTIDAYSHSFVVAAALAVVAAGVPFLVKPPKMSMMTTPIVTQDGEPTRAELAGANA